MSPAVYIVSAGLVFVFSGFMAMAGLGAAFLFVPLPVCIPCSGYGKM